MDARKASSLCLFLLILLSANPTTRAEEFCFVVSHKDFPICFGALCKAVCKFDVDVNYRGNGLYVKDHVCVNGRWPSKSCHCTLCKHY